MTSTKSLLMLHNLVAPVMILAASICIESSCFFASFEQFEKI